MLNTELCSAAASASKLLAAQKRQNKISFYITGETREEEASHL